MYDFMKTYSDWLAADRLDAGLVSELHLIQGDTDAIAERFGSELEFGTGGMRGLLGAGTNRMNIYTVRRASAGFAAYIKTNHASISGASVNAMPSVVISHDNRRYSREFALATAGVFAAAGVRAYIFDSLRPTPELSFAVRRLSADGGVMITASHNPPEYNGYKIYGPDGCQLLPDKSDEVIARIDEVPDMLSIKCLTQEEAGDLIVTLGHELDDEYCMRVGAIALSRDTAAHSRLRVVYSPQHGTGNIPVRRVLTDRGYDVIPVLSQCDPDPDFKGTVNPNPEAPAAYTAALALAEETCADIVITTDPDCDRLGVAARREGKLTLMTGNQSAAVLLEYILSRRAADGSLPENPLMITTVVTSELGDRICRAYGVAVEKTLTGFKFIGERIARHNERHDASFVFGYEESYGCLISDFVRDKDGVQASLMLCEAAAYYKTLGLTLADVLDRIYAKYGYFLDWQSNFFFRGLDGQARIAALTSALRENAPRSVDGVDVKRVEDYLTEEMQAEGFPPSDVLRFVFADGSFVAVRPSGTEPKCKFYYCVVTDNSEDAEARLRGLRAAFEPKV